MWMSPADIDTRPQEPAFPRVSLLFQTVHEDRFRLKALADYSIATDGWPRGVSVNASRGRATEKK